MAASDLVIETFVHGNEGAYSAMFEQEVANLADRVVEHGHRLERQRLSLRYFVNLDVEHTQLLQDPFMDDLSESLSAVGDTINDLNFTERMLRGGRERISEVAVVTELGLDFCLLVCNAMDILLFDITYFQGVIVHVRNTLQHMNCIVMSRALMIRQIVD